MGRPTSPHAARPAPSRRDVASLLAAGAAAALLRPGSAAAQGGAGQAAIQAALGEGQRFAPAALVDYARALSKKPFVPQAPDLTEPYASITYDRYAAIKALPAGRIWGGENRGFVVEPLVRGGVFSTAVSLFTVEEGQVRRVTFDRSRFDFGPIAVAANAPDPGFSGFRLEASGAGGAPFDFAVVQGATFLRAIARGQNFGTVARALVLKAAEARGEEFPYFRAFWIERPSAGTNALVVHALLDSDSVAGALRMTFRPGEMTIVDVETTLFPRVALEHYGLGGAGATFLFGPNIRRTADDIRPTVQDAGGLSMLNGQGEWIWRPLNNPDSLQISAFVDKDPKGFGLLQRNRDFAAYQDDVQRFESKPSVWIEPLGEWQEGAVQLIEIPSDAELNDNILAYWRPKAPLAAGAEATIAYRQFWCWTPPEKPAVAVTMTRSGRGGGRRRRFIVEFGGEPLAAAVPDLKATLTSNLGQVNNVRIWTYPDRSSARVAFELEPGSETAIELRLVLLSGASPISETWLYRWTT